MKGRKNRSTGGRDDATADVDSKPEMRVNAKKIDSEANERAAGGRAGRKSGGIVHHEDMSRLAHASHVGKVHGAKGRAHGGRSPRASGGRTGSDGQPFSSAHKGTNPSGRTEQNAD